MRGILQIFEKWMQALEWGKIASEKDDEIRGFFYTDRYSAFFVEYENGKVHEAFLIKKFNDVLNLPSVKNLNRFTREIREFQYNRHAEFKNEINLYTVEQYKKNIVAMTNNIDFRKLAENVKRFSLRFGCK